MMEVLKKVAVGIVTVAMMLLLGAVPVDASTTDRAVVEHYVTSHYDKPVKYVPEGSSKVKHRKGKSYVVVEHLKTTCQGGKVGKTTKGYRVKYCKADKKGRKVDVYLVYNPRNNKIDDVVCMVDHGKRK